MGTFIDKITGRLVSIDAVTEEKVMAITANGKVYFKPKGEFTPEEIAKEDGKTRKTAYQWTAENYRCVEKEGCCVLLHRGDYLTKWDCSDAKIEGENACGDIDNRLIENRLYFWHEQTDICVENMMIFVTQNVYGGCISSSKLFFLPGGEYVFNAILSDSICYSEDPSAKIIVGGMGLSHSSFHNIREIEGASGLSFSKQLFSNIEHCQVSYIDNCTLRNVRRLNVGLNIGSYIEDAGIYYIFQMRGATIVRAHFSSDLQAGQQAILFSIENQYNNLFRDCKFGKNDMNISIFKSLSTKNKFKGIIEFEQAILGDFIFEPLVLDDECTLKIIFRNSSPTDCTLTLPQSDTEIQHLCVENVVAIQAGVSIFVLTVKKLASDIYTYDIVGYRN